MTAESKPTMSSNWIPVSERLPEVCKPVIGYADRWVDSEYNEMGMRECFRNDDYWQSAAWNNYQDCWDVEQGAPDYWMPFPDAPTVGRGNEKHAQSPVNPTPLSSPVSSVERDAQKDLGDETPLAHKAETPPPQKTQI